MQPKATLLIIGGAEDKAEEFMDMKNKNIKFKRYEILKTLLCNSKNKTIEIITTGSKLPDEAEKSYEYAFQKMGSTNLKFIHIRHPYQAKQKKYLQRIDEAGAVFFSGGDQSRLSRILRFSPFIEAIKKKFFNDVNFLLAGTSAGAMALSDLMIKSGDHSEAMIKCNLKLGNGLNIISNLIIDTHFIKRGRFGRLAQAITYFPDHLGIGLGEDTALIIKNRNAECKGSGMVVIIDGGNITATNSKEAKKHEPIYVKNLRVHLLIKGTFFKLPLNIYRENACPK